MLCNKVGKIVFVCEVDMHIICLLEYLCLHSNINDYLGGDRKSICSIVIIDYFTKCLDGKIVGLTQVHIASDFLECREHFINIRAACKSDN